MRLLSFNVNLFESNNVKIKNFLKSRKVDILCAQEVTKDASGKANKKYITKDVIDASTVNLKYSFYSPDAVFRHFKAYNFHGKQHFYYDFGGNIEDGLYIKSKYKITKGQAIFLQNHFTYVTDWSNWPEEDYKAIQVSDLLIKGKPLRILNYHGIWSKNKLDTNKTIAACKKIKELALEVAYPAIICGDFNLFPDTKSMQVFNKNFKSLVDEYRIATTRISTNELSKKERNVIDYMFINKSIEVKSFEVIKSNISDHLPLLLSFDL